MSILPVSRAAVPFALLALLPSLLSAQAAPPWQAGLVAGVGRTSLAGRPDADPRAGWTVGAFASRRLGGSFRLRGELLATTGVVQGQVGQCGAFSCRPEPVTEDDIIRTRFRMLQMPLLLAWEPATAGHRVAPMLHLGGFAAVRNGCQATAHVAGVESAWICTNDLRQLDAGLVMGGGLRYRGVGLGLRWTRGLRNLGQPVPADGSSTFYDGRSSTLALVVDLIGVGRRD